MKVYVEPIPLTLSQAMHRVARALKRYAQPDIQFVNRPEQADLQVMHVIGLDSMEALKAPKYVVIQYCLMTTDAANNVWKDIWTKAEMVFSYYDLNKVMDQPFNFLRSPLGVDSIFFEPRINLKDLGVITTGYVSGPGAEAIEEVAIAASLAGLKGFHVGPHPVGMGKPPLGWVHQLGVTDEELANLYSRARWVAGLRHVEGFEMPMAEGFACGARPIAFDREDMRHWWGDSAIYVQERSGRPLIQDLVEIFRNEPQPITDAERLRHEDIFNWERIVNDFWVTALKKTVYA